MTAWSPLPEDVVCAIRAAKLHLSAEAVTGSAYGRPMWVWGADETRGKWVVGVGERPGYQSVRGTGQADSPREALLAALAELAAVQAAAAKAARRSAKSCRYPEARRSREEKAERAEAAEAGARALVARIAELWPT